MTPVRILAAVLFAAVASPAFAATLNAVCSLERPIIGYGEHVAVTALTDAPAGTPIEVTWSADSGVLSQGSTSASAVWAPTSEAHAVYTIQAHIVAAGDSAGCMTRIAVTDRLTRGGEETLVSTRSLLAPDVPEAAGYGLYSYVLLTAPQTDQERDLIEAILNSYLTLLSAVDFLERQYPQWFARPRLNVTYLPIARPLPDDFGQRNDQTAWIRNHYDYDRAFAFLSRLRSLPGENTVISDGTVWIVSCSHPLSGAENPGPVLPLNLSAVPVRLIPLVMRAFRDQTTQPRDYNAYALPRLRLDLRIGIGQLAEGLQPVMAAVKVLGGSGARE